MKCSVLFSDPQFKKNTWALLSILLLLLGLQWWCYQSGLEQQKQDYVDVVGAIGAKVVSVAPEYEDVIIHTVAVDLTEQDRAAGRAWLSEYGITKEVDNRVFPHLDATPTAFFVTLAAIVVLLILHCGQYAAVLKQVRSLTAASRHLLDQDYSCAIAEDNEGDFSKLAVAFGNIRRVIQNNMAQTQAEKQQLVELLQNISHQFKTKLATMLLYNDILLNRNLSDQQRIQFLQDNAVQLHGMNEMIQRLLKLARLDAHAVAYEKKNASISSLLVEIAEEFREMARQHGVTLSLDDNEDFSMPLDRFWLKEALQNIVKNCMEHTPSGGCVIMRTEVSPLFHRIVIQDTGEGIDQADLPHIFQRFYKSKISNKKDSVGIGLAISKTIIEGHDGYIQVMSKKEQGSTFYITFSSVLS